jgi:hypothetical protein
LRLWFAAEIFGQEQAARRETHDPRFDALHDSSALAAEALKEPKEDRPSRSCQGRGIGSSTLINAPAKSDPQEEFDAEIDLGSAGLAFGRPVSQNGGTAS